MADFASFSAQGPVVPINLFTQNAAAGTDIGNAVPTGVTAAIQGGFKGIEAGQQITANMEQSAIRQEQIKAQQQINEINALKLDITKQTQELQLNNTIMELQNKKQLLQEQAVDIGNKQEISTRLASGDPDQMRSILNDPKLLNTMLSDTKFADAAAGRLSSVLTPEESKKLFAQVDFKKSQELKAMQERADAQARDNLFKTTEKDVDKIQEGKLGWLFSSKGDDLTTGLGKVTTAPSAQGLANGWDVFYDGQRTSLNINDAENAAFSRTMQAYTSAGLVKKKLPQTTATGDPASAAPKEEKPFLSAFRLFGSSDDQAPIETPGPPPTGAPIPDSARVQTQSNNPIVQQRARQLQQQAQSDPDLMNRLIAKGIVKAPPKQSIAAAAPTATPAPVGVTIEGETQEEVGAFPPPQPVPPEVTKQNIAERVSVLPKEVKNKVEHPVVFKILSDPLTRGLPPLYKAVVAVESKGERNAKNKGSSATGLFQLTDAAAKETGTDSSIPAENVKGGVTYLNSMLEQFGDNEIPALMAYIGGPGLIRSAVESAGSADYEDIVYALKRFKDQGRFKASLKNIDHIIKYPLKVLAYKEAFQAFSDA